ncbi:MAG: DedA family protein [Bacteroidales bacterium]|nr:DedA family protein [Bacteroidales bacterium]MDD4603389.1 DedA family protein [Bacteroidales bacterium]
MEHFKEVFEILINSEKLIQYGGLTLLLIVIFAETGVFFGFIFPGDALLFTAGLLCNTQLEISIYWLVISVALAAIVGNITGFFTGKYLGKRIFQKKDTRFFKQEHIQKTHQYYEKYGGFALIGGRFLPVIRTFVPILAGAIDMNFWKFTLFNCCGAILWSGTFIPMGYLIGRKFPASLDHIEYFILGITIITMTIFLRGIYKMNKRKKQ